MYGTLGFAIDEMVIPRMKTVRPVHSYRGYLTLGDPENYDTAMAIDVERYPRVMVAKAPSASQFVVRANMAPGDTQSQYAPPDEETKLGDLAAVKNARTYQVPDEDAPGGKREVEQDELSRGFNYGSTVVPIEEADKTVTDFESKQGMDIIGFVVKDQVRHVLLNLSYPANHETVREISRHVKDSCHHRPKNEREGHHGSFIIHSCSIRARNIRCGTTSAQGWQESNYDLTCTISRCRC